MLSITQRRRLIDRKVSDKTNPIYKYEPIEIFSELFILKAEKIPLYADVHVRITKNHMIYENSHSTKYIAEHYINGNLWKKTRDQSVKIIEQRVLDNLKLISIIEGHLAQEEN